MLFASLMRGDPGEVGLSLLPPSRQQPDNRGRVESFQTHGTSVVDYAHGAAARWWHKCGGGSEKTGGHLQLHCHHAGCEAAYELCDIAQGGPQLHHPSQLGSTAAVVLSAADRAT